MLREALDLKKDGLSRNSLMNHGDELLNCLPPESGEKKALKHFADIIGVSSYNSYGLIRGANEGVINHFQKMLQNDSCFENDLKKFHKSIMQSNEEAISDISRLLNTPLKNRPSLGASAGKGHFKKFEPGWIWKKALEVSNGDAQRALSLINVCGNDDVLTKPINFSSGEQLNCAAVTFGGYFAPESLGEGVDITESLKKKIVDVQYSNKGSTYAPAKYYHVYNSAFMACELISKGMAANDAEDINALLASAYRATRLKERVAEVEGFQSTYDQKKSNGELPGNISLEDFVRNDRREFWLQMHGNSDPARINRLVESDTERLDAVSLIKRWELGSNVPILGIPLYTNLKISTKNRKDIPSGWSKQRFDDAVKRLETFIVDSDWSTAQARVGASFATKHCKKQEDKAISKNCQRGAVPIINESTKSGVVQ